MSVPGDLFFKEIDVS